MDNNGDKLDEKKKKEYLGTRYSQQLFGENSGSVTDSSNKRMEEKERITKEMFWKATGEEDYRKEETMKSKKQHSAKEKNISTTKIFKRYSPRNLVREFYSINNLTPEEIEALIEIKNNYLKYIKFCSIGFWIFLLPYIYKFQSSISKSFFLICSMFGGVICISTAFIFNMKPSLIILDQLGKEYPLSRSTKQFIFTKRKDLTPEMKAEIYMELNKKNEELEKQLIIRDKDNKTLQKFKESGYI